VSVSPVVAELESSPEVSLLAVAAVVVAEPLDDDPSAEPPVVDPDEPEPSSPPPSPPPLPPHASASAAGTSSAWTRILGEGSGGSMRIATDRATTTVCAIQGAYFFATGLWPLVHMRSFERVTGRKRDDWLVETVGALVAVGGAVMLRAAAARAVDRSTAMLAVGSAAALGAVETVHALRGRISRIYLLDALLELALIAGWTAASMRRRARSRVSSPRG
jgi:hypothetical protein